MAAFELVRGAVSSVKTKLRKRNSSDFFRYTAAGESEGALRRRSIVPSKLAHDLGDSVISTAFSDDDLLYAAEDAALRAELLANGRIPPPKSDKVRKMRI